MIQKYIKRPVTIEAVQYTGDNAEEIMSLVGLHLMLTEIWIKGVNQSTVKEAIW